MRRSDHRSSSVIWIVAAAIAAAAIALPGAGAQAPPLSNGDPAALPPQFSRIISVRVFHTRFTTVRNSNARRIGRSLAGLHPTWVSGLIRYARGQHPSHSEARGWSEITRIIRATNPQARFDVTLNAKQYRDGGEIQRMMSRVREKLHNDGWFFDFFSKAFRKRPRMIRAAIASAHAHGEWIGGNFFGIAKQRQVPVLADFIAVQDFHRLNLNLLEIRRISGRIPVVYHLNNDPDSATGGGCKFIENFTTARRQALIRHRAANQATYGFRVSYPVLFPECKRRGGSLYSYNVFRDPPMLETIMELLDLYD